MAFFAHLSVDCLPCALFLVIVEALLSRVVFVIKEKTATHS